MPLLQMPAQGVAGHISDHDLIAGLLNKQYAWQTLTPAAGATAAPDLAVGTSVLVTMPAGNITLGPTTDSTGTAQVGERLLYEVTQDGVGGRTITWDASSYGAGVPQPNPVAGATTVYEFVCVTTGSPRTWRLVAVTPGRLSALADASVGGVTDGQLLSYQASSGLWVPVAPSGNNEMAYGANTTGTVTSVTGGNGSFVYVDVPNCAVTVTNSAGRPVWLSAYGLMQQTVAGAGMAVLNIVETTSGAVNLFSGAGTPLPNTVAAVMKNVDLTAKPFRIGAVTTTRTFKLQIGIFGNGVAPAGQVVNSAALPTWLLAEVK